MYIGRSYPKKQITAELGIPPYSASKRLIKVAEEEM